MESVCTHSCVCVHVCLRVCVPVLTGLEAVSLVGWLGCEWPESQGSLIMPDRLISGGSCCISIATDRASVSPLNLFLHTGKKGVQVEWGRRELGMEHERSVRDRGDRIQHSSREGVRTEREAEQ